MESYYGQKRRRLEAYLLLEALVGMWLFSLVAGLFVSTIREARRREGEILHREEVLQEGHMALQTGRTQLGSIRVERTDSVWTIKEGEEILVQVHLLKE